MQVDTSADSTVITSLIWTELGKPQLNGKVRRLEAYDGHQLTLLGSLTCDVEWNGSKYEQQLAVVQSDKKFGLLGRDIPPHEGINAVSDARLPAVKGYKEHVKLIPGSQPMFCKASKISLLLQDRVKEKLETMVRQGILEPVQPGGGHKCVTSSVAAEGKWSSETMRGPESSHQWQSYGRGLSNPRHEDYFP